MLAVVEPDLRTEILEALADPFVESTSLARILEGRNLPAHLSAETLQRHRRHDCQCPVPS